MQLSYILTGTPVLDPILNQTRHSPLVDRVIRAGFAVRTEGEIQPGYVAPALAKDRQGKLRAFPMKWGFTVSSGIQSRTFFPTVSRERFLASAALSSHPAVIPCAWLLCTDRRNRRCLVQPSGCEETFIAGTYRLEKNLPVFALLTELNDSPEAELDERLFLLPQNAVRGYCEGGEAPERFLSSCITDILCEPEG